MKNAIAAAIATIVLGAVALPASATTTLFQSLPNVSSGVFTSSLASEPNSYNNAFRVYDAFTLSTASTITSADFLVAAYSVPATGELSVYSVINGVAGALLFSQTLTTASVTAISAPNAGIAIDRVTVDPTDFNLAAGTYFISLAGVNYAPFAMATFATTGATASAYTYQSITNSANGVGGYAVYGTAAAAVPEPSMLALFGLGAAACAFMARRRRA